MSPVIFLAIAVLDSAARQRLNLRGIEVNGPERGKSKKERKEDPTGALEPWIP
jgi:hypothetical protein